MSTDALLQAAIRDVLNMAATRDEHREALYRLESAYANWKPALSATPPASADWTQDPRFQSPEPDETYPEGLK